MEGDHRRFLIAGFVVPPMRVFNDSSDDTGGAGQLLERVGRAGRGRASRSCARSNVPLAAVLWAGGISFGG
jgi:hypothetical protein